VSTQNVTDGIFMKIGNDTRLGTKNNPLQFASGLKIRGSTHCSVFAATSRAETVEENRVIFVVFSRAHRLLSKYKYSVW